MPGKTKLTNENSSVILKPNTKEQFDNNVSAHESAHSTINDKSLKLGLQFFEVLADKTLSQNKGEISKKYELELIKELQALSSAINNDISMPDGSGSTAMESILFSSIIRFRNRINEIEYNLIKETNKNKELEGIIKTFESRLSQLEAK